MPRKHWADTQDAIPDRMLYLRLNELEEQSDAYNKKYDFTFLSKTEVSEYKRNGIFIFPVAKILEFQDVDELSDFLDSNNVEKRTFGRKAVLELFQKVNKDKLINYYLEEDSSNIDKVLEIFVRTNSGGTALSYSDLLMSILSAKWNSIDARKSVDTIIDALGKIIPGQFYVSRDFVMKTCLVLFSSDIKFRLSNFTPETIQKIEQNWERIESCMIAVFSLINTLGFNGSNLRSLNAIIPIIYYVYINSLEKQIGKATYSRNERRKIQVWLNLSLLKGVFGGQSDRVLSKMKKIIKMEKDSGENAFPAKKIIDEFNADSNSYEVTDANFEDWLNSQYGSNEADYLLYLLYPNLDYYNQDFHRDHLHAKSLFNSSKSLNALKKVFESDDDYLFASNPVNWNSVANLQFLNGLLNEKKKEKSLKEWAIKNSVDNQSLLINPNTSLELKDFRQFINDRRRVLRTIIEDRIKID